MSLFSSQMDYKLLEGRDQAFPECLSQFRLLQQIPQTEWVKQQAFISHGSGGWKSKIRRQPGWVLGEGPLMYLHGLPLWVHTERNGFLFLQGHC